MFKITCFSLILFSCLGVLLAQSRFPVVTKFVEPPFPPAARAVRAEGDVIVLLEINSEGKALNGLAVSGHPLLRKTAEAAAKNWEFSSVPGIHYLNIVFRFRIPDRGKWKPANLTGHVTMEFIEPRYQILHTKSHQTASRQ